METKSMETKDILLQLRTKAGLSQDELAERMFVTRQAVSRWERGDTLTNTGTLKRLSKLFDVSHQHIAWRGERADLPMLRHAA